MGTEYSQRAPMYGDLTRLLVPGFLSATVRVDGHSYSLRSLHSGDLFNLTAAAPTTDPTWRMWVVAASLWAVDGVYLLGDSAYAPREAYRALSRSSGALVGKLFGTCVGFFRRIREANQFLEAYLYEEESRRLWEGTGRGRYPLWTRSSLPGLERLGFNQFQASWMAWNQMEDQRQEQEHAWSLTKVMVSLQSHKSYEKLESRDRARAQSVAEARAEARERAWAYYCGETDESGRPVGAEARQRGPRTPEELAEEMRKWMAGDLDFHDQVVAEYKERVRQHHQEIEEQAAELRRIAAEKREREESDLGVARPRLVAATPEQLAALLPAGGVRRVHDESPVRHTFNRYLKSDPSPGYLKVGDDGRVAPSRETPPEAAAMSLNDLIAARAPRFDGE